MFAFFTLIATTVLSLQLFNSLKKKEERKERYSETISSQIKYGTYWFDVLTVTEKNETIVDSGTKSRQLMLAVRILLVNLTFKLG